MNELEEAEMIAERIVEGGLDEVELVIHEDILLLAEQFLEVKQAMFSSESPNGSPPT